MGTNVTGTTLRGLLVPDPRITFATAFSKSLSSVTQQGPLPGVPEAQDETEMVLESSGTQSANKKLRVRCQKAGMPGTDKASFIWRNDGDADYRGWDPPQSIVGFEFIDYTTTSPQWRGPDSVALADGKFVVVVEKASTGQVICWTRTPSNGAWSSAVVFTHAGVYTFTANPTVVLLPSGRLLCFAWVEQSGTANQVRMFYSDDDGDTWDVGQSSCLAANLTVGGTITPGRLRARYLNGQILLVAAVQDTALTNGDVFVQYASADLGASFTKLDTWTGAGDTTHGAYHDLIAYGGTYVFVYLRRDTATTGSIVPYVRIVGSAFELLSGASAKLLVGLTNPQRWGTVSGNDFTSAENLALWADDDGTIYIIGIDFADLSAIYVKRSIDGGSTWETMGDSAAAAFGGTVWQGRDGSTYPRDFCVASYGGRGLLIHRFNALPETHDPSLCALYFGGYTTVCLPALSSFPTPTERVGWERTWLPYDLPSDTGGIYTAVTAGPSPTATMTSTGVRLQGSNVADTYSYTLGVAPVSTLTQGLVTMIHMEVDAGTGVLDVRVANATPVSYSVRVEVTTTSLVLHDLHGGILATVSGISTTTGVQIMVALGNSTVGLGNTGCVQAWYRLTTKGGETDRKWLAIGSSSTLAFGAVPSNHIQWGFLTGAASSDVRVLIHQYTYGIYAGAQLYAGPANPNDLLGRSLAATPVYVDDGVKIAGVDGPAFRADEWNIDTRYEWPVDNVHWEIARSPRKAWRSVNDDVQQDLIWELDATLTEDSPLLGASLALYLGEINFKSAQLHGRDVTGAFVLLASIDANVDASSLKFTRDGELVVPDTSGGSSTGLYYPHHILAGSHFAFSSGEPTVRKIITNSSGMWKVGSITKPTTLYLSGVTGSEPAAGATGQIWTKDIAVIVNNPTKYTAYRLRIPVQNTAEGYFTVGKVLLGHLFVMGRQYSRGRAQEWVPNLEITAGRSGARRIRKQGPTRREVEISWDEGIDVSQATAKSPNPDYVGTYTGSTVPVAAPADTPYSLAGLLDQLGETPVVYLPAIEVQVSAATVIVHTNRETMLYASMLPDSIRLDNVLGDEWQSPGEVLRTGRVLLSEEV
jgi:hypothetical protein